MRVASNTLYNVSINRLNRVKYQLMEVNTRVATGKKVNSISDDPVSIAPILNLRSSISSVEQFSTNIAVGRQWLEGAETALSNVKELITEAKTTSIAMLNGIMTEEDYISGYDMIEGIREHIETLANTQVNGQYIFSGTKTNIRPFERNDEDNPTKMVYQGSENMFGIKMAEISNVDVGYCGNDVFQMPYIVIDDTNNKIDFREDPLGAANRGAELTAVIPTGKYSPEELAISIETVMNERSAASSHAEIMDISQNDATVVVDNYDALTMPTGAGLPLTLTYSAALNSWTITNDPGYTPPISYDTLESDASSVYLDFNGDSDTDMTVNFDNPVPDGYSVSFDITAAGGNAVNYSVGYNEGTQKFTIMEQGVATLDSLEMMWATGSNSATSIGVDIGFDGSANLTGPADGVTHQSDDEVEWGIFRTLIDLKQYLRDADEDGINRSIARLSADFDYMGSIVSEIGIKGNRLDVRDNIISDLNISYESTKMKLEDADMIEEITKLDQKDFAYNAAMNATAKIINMSLLDYL